jgi:hypothetical protein
MRNTMICFRDILNAIPYFAALGNEVVVRIDDEKCSNRFIELKSRHAFPPRRQPAACESENTALLHGRETGTSRARRSLIPVQLSALNVARISSTKVFGAAAAAQTSLIVTSTLPRIALEYVQICSAASTSS